MVAAGSPNANMAQTAATSGRSVSPKTRMSSRTIAGYATIPVSRRGTALR